MDIALKQEIEDSDAIAIMARALAAVAVGATPDLLDVLHSVPEAKPLPSSDDS